MYEDIRPYDDAETSAALKRVADNPLVDKISDFLFPGKNPEDLRIILRSIKGVDDFQTRVMRPAVGSIIKQTTDGLSFEGLEHFEGGKKRFLMLSSHRDIVLDPAFVQYVLKTNGLPLTEIAVGDNLIANEFIGDLMRSNRMIKVVRSGSPRELYKASSELSAYIRERLMGNDPSSVWIAHRGGRTKDGMDRTDQGLLKMLSISGRSDFLENMKELQLMPLAISYEIESCDVLKAVETAVKARTGEYHKRPGEDTNSILTGILQPKGRVHIKFCKPIQDSEIDECASLDKNERFRHLADIVDSRITEGFRLWPTNVAAARILKKTGSLPEGVTREEILERLLAIYAAPAIRVK